MSKSYFFEYPVEVPLGPLFGESCFTQIDKYEEGVGVILKWVVLRDPSMGGVTVDGAIDELRALLGSLRIVSKYSQCFPDWRQDFKTLCTLWYKAAEIRGKAIREGVNTLSLQSQLGAARELLVEGEYERASEVLGWATENLHRKLDRLYDMDD